MIRVMIIFNFITLNAERQAEGLKKAQELVILNGITLQTEL